MTNFSTEDKRKAPGHRPARRRFFFAAWYTIYLVVLLLIGSKLFWHFGFGVPVTRSLTQLDLWVSFYPDVHDSGLSAAEIKPDDDYFDVLVLGGSVMDQAANILEEQLRKRVGDRLRYFNIAEAAHTSRDSYLKFQLFSDRQFDLVVVYNGINDVAMNNVSQQMFRDDYTHCFWYAAMRDRIITGKR